MSLFQQPTQYSLEAFVEGVKILTGKENPLAFMESDHDVVYVGTEEITENSEDGLYLQKLGFYWNSSSDSWCWHT